MYRVSYQVSNLCIHKQQDDIDEPRTQQVPHGFAQSFLIHIHEFDESQLFHNLLI